MIPIQVVNAVIIAPTPKNAITRPGMKNSKKTRIIPKIAHTISAGIEVNDDKFILLSLSNKIYIYNK